MARTYETGSIEWIDDTAGAKADMENERRISQEVLDVSGKDWLAMMNVVYNFQNHYKKLWGTVLTMPEFQGENAVKKTISHLYRLMIWNGKGLTGICVIVCRKQKALWQVF